MKLSYALLLFQSTRPLRGATNVLSRKITNTVISIHAPLAGRDASRLQLSLSTNVISIHAPLAGRDDYGDSFHQTFVISIHAPLAGRDDFLVARFQDQ